MRSQSEDLEYGYERERVNQPRIEEHLGVKLCKLDKFSVMDWKEIQKADDSTAPWLVEQKARRCSLEFLTNTYSYNGKPTALIGKNKIDFMKFNGGCGIVYFDFTDKLMYWVYDEEEYKTFDVEMRFVRNKRSGYVDKEHPVVHIPTIYLKECDAPELPRVAEKAD